VKNDSQDPLIAEARRTQAQREKGYRERALKLYPPICAHCGREFSGKRLRELTVHHKDHNHDNNPSDGSNWELLCLYCHDNEHARNRAADAHSGSPSTREGEPPLASKPFADLAELLKRKT
jgi:5-methylcytosine-specific restriction endonuclease McrA